MHTQIEIAVANFLAKSSVYRYDLATAIRITEDHHHDDLLINGRVVTVVAQVHLA